MRHREYDGNGGGREAIDSGQTKAVNRAAVAANDMGGRFKDAAPDTSTWRERRQLTDMAPPADGGHGLEAPRYGSSI
jgi:hypothetical protein